jgi:hypothetical protein
MGTKNHAFGEGYRIPACRFTEHSAPFNGKIDSSLVRCCWFSFRAFPEFRYLFTRDVGRVPRRESVEAISDPVSAVGVFHDAALSGSGCAPSWRVLEFHTHEAGEIDLVRGASMVHVDVFAQQVIEEEIGVGEGL